jgi:ABC-type polysaccharide/polyol phosphate export permease
MFRRAQRAWRYRDLLRALVRRDLRVKYKDSTLGFAWSLLHPVLMVAVYTLAFRYIVRIPIQHFPVFLISGLLPWMFFSSALLVASGAILDHGGLIRKVAFPREILPLSAVVSQFVQFALMYAVVLPILVYFGIALSWSVLALVPLALLQLLFTSGFALALATSQVYFRDTRHLLEIGLQVWFWLTPIVYSVSLAPPLLQTYLWLNPMTLFIGAYRSIVLEQAMPAVWLAISIVGCAIGTALIGYQLFSTYERRFAELV